MREIKFRGKRLDNGEWVHGGYFESDKTLSTKHYWILPIDIFNSVSWENMRRTISEVIEVDPSTIGEFTGLKDKNGVDIYEGDTVELCGNTDGKFNVVFENAYVGGWVLRYGNGSDDYISLGARKTKDVEVIQNIREGDNK